MIKPPALKKGDLIGFYSPSSPATYTFPKRFERAKEFLEGKGFRLKKGSLTGKTDLYRSGSIRERAEELNDLIRHPDVRCIISTIGGMNSNALLPYLDYKAFQKNPKILIGYSDVTALLLGMYAMTNVITFYGPALIPSFGEFPPFVDLTFRYFEDALVKEHHLPYHVKKPLYWTDEGINWEEKTGEKQQRPNDWRTVCEGVARGRVVGGNLNTMAGIWGSPYMPEIRYGDILLLEDSLKNAMTVERSFVHLKLAGVFDKVGGIILGKHERFDDQGTGRKPYEILLEVLAGREIPLLADFDCCHTHPMLTLPIGCDLELDATNRKVSILEKWLQ